MRRFFVDPKELDSKTVTLKGDEHHHLKNVSRLEPGENVELLDGEGHIAIAKILKVEKKETELEVLEVETLPEPASPQIEIVLCVPRFQTMDIIIQKVVELGAVQITTAVSDRSFLKTISKDLLGKIPRWQKIAAEACKQSGRAWPIVFSEPITLDEAIRNHSNKAALFLYEGESAVDIKTVLEGIQQVPDRLTVFIGSEGGFSPREVEVFEKSGFKPITLGPLVLRVETACIAVLSVIEYHFGLMR